MPENILSEFNILNNIEDIFKKKTQRIKYYVIFSRF